MGYLFGDATPFPLDENFIETLCSLTDACVSLFQVHNHSLESTQRVLAAQRFAESEMKQVSELGKSLEEMLQPFTSATPCEGAQLAASQIAALARKSITEAMQTITAAREEAAHAAADWSKANEIRKAVSLFLLHHQLPSTTWTVMWKVPMNTAPTCSVVGATPMGLRFAFDVHIAKSSHWKHPIRVSSLEEGATITVSREPGLWSKARRLGKQALHKFVITEVQYGPIHKWFVVRSSAKKPSMGFRLIVQDGSDDTPAIMRLDERGGVLGKREQANRDSAACIRALWTHIDRHVGELIQLRHSLTRIGHGKDTEKECENAGDLAEAMLAAVAPIVREMREKSRVPGELVLKRELGDGKREELFVPRRKLFEKFSILPDSQRRVFDAMGLSTESSLEPDGNIFTEPTVKVEVVAPLEGSVFELIPEEES